MSYKKIQISFVVLSINSFFLIFCLIMLLLDTIRFWNIIRPLVIVLSRLNLMFYNPKIGGHTAHLHDFIILLVVFIFPLIYAISMYFFAKSNHLKNYTITRLGIIVITLAVLCLSMMTNYAFIQRLERSAYTFFVPQA